MRPRLQYLVNAPTCGLQVNRVVAIFAMSAVVGIAVAGDPIKGSKATSKSPSPRLYAVEVALEERKILALKDDGVLVEQRLGIPTGDWSIQGLQIDSKDQKIYWGTENGSELFTK